jgi:hypothetical protein
MLHSAAAGAYGNLKAVLAGWKLDPEVMRGNPLLRSNPNKFTYEERAPERLRCTRDASLGLK